MPPTARCPQSTVTAALADVQVGAAVARAALRAPLARHRRHRSGLLGRRAEKRPTAASGGLQGRTLV